MLVVDVPGVDHRVQLRDGVDLRERDEVVAAVPPDLAFDPALLVRPLDAGLAVERVEAVVGAERGPTFCLFPQAGESDHLVHGRFQVVVPDLADRDPSQHPEGVSVAFEEGLLAAGGRDPMGCLARV